MQMSVVPRKAAAVVLVRPSPTVDGPDGPAEVFLTRRPESMAFAGGNFVFPGGKLDSSDCAPVNLALARGMEAERAAGILGDGEPPDRSLGLWLAAIRELFEEAGILLCTTEAGGVPDLEGPEIQTRLAAGREDVHQRRRTLASLMQELGLYYSAGGLYYLTRWITPVYSPIRFDARYFLGQAPPGQVAEPCPHEVTAARWIQPAEALGRWRTGELKMRGPTSTTLMYLARYSEFSGLLAAAQSGNLGFPPLSAE
ncbi:MAG: NUDIX hydrolase [Candidatus Methylomirabilales bacterium]